MESSPGGNKDKREKIERQELLRARARNQLLFWCTVVGTGLNAILLVMFKPSGQSIMMGEEIPIGQPPFKAPTQIIQSRDKALTDLMGGYIGALPSMKAEIILKMADSVGKNPLTQAEKVDALEFLVGIYRTETLWSREWAAAYEGIVQLGLLDPSLMDLVENKILRVMHDPARPQLRVSALRLLQRLNSPAAFVEAKAWIEGRQPRALRREAIEVIAHYAREGSEEAIALLEAVVKTDLPMRAAALVFLEQTKSLGIVSSKTSFRRGVAGASERKRGREDTATESGKLKK